MDLNIAAFLVQDGIVSGAIYALLALGVVLVFNVTRIAFVSFGDLIAYAALTLSAIQANKLPGTVWLVLTFVFVAVLMDAVDLYRRRALKRFWRRLILYGLIPVIPVGIAAILPTYNLPMVVQIGLTVALILPLGPLIYRVVFQPIHSSSVLVKFMAAVALHFPMAGLALLFFGAEGFRTKPYIDETISLGSVDVSAGSIVVVASVLVIAAVLHFFFERTLWGKGLRATAVNEIGARLVGIRVTSAGATAFLIAAGMAAISGVLIGPNLTVYYDTGFLIGLKGFVGSVIGGFVSYPLAGVGAILIGLIESFTSFYSGTYKDVIVFTLLVPIVLLRWILSRTETEEEEEEL